MHVLYCLAASLNFAFKRFSVIDLDQTLSPRFALRKNV